MSPRVSLYAVLLWQSGQHLDAVKAVRQDNIGSGLEACRIAVWLLTDDTNPLLTWVA